MAHTLLDINFGRRGSWAKDSLARFRVVFSFFFKSKGRWTRIKIRTLRTIQLHKPILVKAHNTISFSVLFQCIFYCDFENEIVFWIQNCWIINNSHERLFLIFVQLKSFHLKITIPAGSNEVVLTVPQLAMTRVSRSKNILLNISSA